MVTKVKLGTTPFAYEVAVGWAKPPPGYSWRDVAAVAVDSKDRVYAFGRSDPPMMVFDKEGNFLNSWGENLFERAHGLAIAPDDTLYCVSDHGHVVRHCTPDGKVLMTIGEPGRASKPHSGFPFNKCTDVALDPKTGDIYVADGYLNSSVHKYSPDGRLLFSWGTPGTDPGEFNIPHNIATDRDGYVYVADRENHRVQVFDSNGRYETQWANMHRPSGIYVSKEQHVYVAELGAELTVNREVPNIGPRVSIFDTSGKRLARLGHPGFGFEVGQFMAPHGICLDSAGDIYVGEVDWTYSRVLGQPRDPVRSLQKLLKVA